MYFPEGTWNLSPNLPVLPFYRGIIDVALEANAIIIPVAVEQYGKQFVTKIGSNFDCRRYGEQGKAEVLAALRNRMAELKWEIWETVPAMNRKAISKNYYEKFLEEKIGGWKFSSEYFRARIYKNQENIPPDEVFEPIRKLHII